MLFAANEPEKTKPWYAIGIDIEKCIGCGMCAKACKLENDVPQEPFFYRSWVEQYTIKNDGSISVQSPNGGIDGFTQAAEDTDIFKTFFVPNVQPLRQIALRTGLPGWRHLRKSGRRSTG
jgi:ferredoxin